MTAAAYTPAVPARGLFRKTLHTLEAYIRIDLVEERMFPANTILRYIGLVFPVLLYFYQTTYLGSSNRFAVMLIGTSIITGLQDSLTALTQRLQFAQERGTLETYLVEPVPWALIPVAMNVWRSFTGAVMACLMVAFGVALGADIKPSAIPLALVVLVLGVAACNAIGTLAASFLILFKRGEPIIMLYSLAAAVLGGALFPISQLPPWIRWASYLVPHSYVISAERQLLMPDPPADSLSVWASVGILVGICVVMFTVGLTVFDRSLKLARRLGILSI